MKLASSVPFGPLGARLIAARSETGLTQTDLAKALDIKQQSVSRWEAGTHRPVRDMIPALARLLKADETELLTLADYAEIPVASATPPFPIEFLTPEMFEQFTADLLRARYPEADVQQQGSRGHKQEGTDILVIFPDRKIWSFQCKREERFGPADVRKAIEYHSVTCDRAFLVLSKTASPAAAAAVRQFPNWTLWDKQDLGGLIRQLAPEQQDRLVDTYFHGQRMALLGRSEPGPWLTMDEYYAPFSGRAVALSHDWQMEGRTGEIEALTSALAKGENVTLLTGAGGIGKTRVLKEAVKQFSATHKGHIVRFLSPSGEPDRTGLVHLGTRPKLLVIDDAHDRDSLTALIEYAADRRNKTQLVISSRPYAEQQIRNQLAIFNITAPPHVRLEPLDKATLRPLVEKVLTEFGGDAGWADAVLSVAQDSPLVAAMAARVIARDGVPLELARKEAELRQVVLAKFTNVIAGNLGGPFSAELIRQVLETLVLIQPFRLDENGLARLITAVRSSIDADQVGRILKLLTEGGVLYQRGALYRLMPDLLADFLIESSCVGIGGKLTDFARRVASEVDERDLPQVLINLGRMDWRMQDGDPSGSHLLAPLWADLRQIEYKYDRRLEAVKAVAIYQPAQALEFIQAQLDAGRQFPEFGQILRQVALTPEYRREALRLLWDLGCNDPRSISSHTNHPIRILTDLLDYSENKPLDFIEDIAAFAFDLLDDSSAWSCHHSPFDVLRPLLSGEGTNTHWRGHEISITPYFVHYDAVAVLRARVIDSILDRLTALDPHTAYRAATFLSEALRGPTGIMNSHAPEPERIKFDAEFLQTVRRVGEILRGGSLVPTTVLGLIASLDWFAEYHDGELGDTVRAIFADLPQTTDFRLHAALTEGASYRFVGQVRYEEWEEDRAWAAPFIRQLIDDYPDMNLLYAAISERLTSLEMAGVATGANGWFIDAIIDARPDFARTIIRNVEGNPTSRMQYYLGYALGAVLERKAAEGRDLIATFLASGEPVLRQGATRAMISLRRANEPEDVRLLRNALTSDDPKVANIAVTALRTWQDMPAREVIDLACLVQCDRYPELLEAVAMLLCNRHHKAVRDLTERDAECLLEKMSGLPQLEGHWTEELLRHFASRCPERLMAFVLLRADKAMNPTLNEPFEVLSYSLRRTTFDLQNAPDATSLLRRIWSWLRSKDDGNGTDHYIAAETFGALFQIPGAAVVSFFEALLERAAPNDLRWIARILRHGDHTFPLQHSGFVEQYLLKCREAGQDVLEYAVSMMEAAAFSGSWTGTSGKPMPRDVDTQRRASEIIAGISRLSPAYRFYKDILESASRRIEETIQNSKLMDAEE